MSAGRDLAAMQAARRTMVDCQVRPSDVTTPALVDAMLWAPRELFAPKSKRAQAYVGEHLELTAGRYELDPRVFAKLADLAKPRDEDLTLVVGAGLGYAPAVLSRVSAAVIALEEDPAMAAAMRAALESVGADNVIVVEGPLAAGCAAHAPYNLILVNGALPGEPPEALARDLADDGRLVGVQMRGPVGRGVLWTKANGVFGSRSAFDASAPVLPGFEMNEGFVF